MPRRNSGKNAKLKPRPTGGGGPKENLLDELRRDWRRRPCVKTTYAKLTETKAKETVAELKRDKGLDAYAEHCRACGFWHYHLRNTR